MEIPRKKVKVSRDWKPEERVRVKRVIDKEIDNLQHLKFCVATLPSSALEGIRRDFSQFIE
jgi:hypothetical protein